MEFHVKRLWRWFADNQVLPTESPPQAEKKAFAYDPLDEKSDSIRLLKVLPGTRSGGVWCVLEEFPFRIAPPYSALSYAWGPPHPCVEIRVNGRLFEIRENLFHFLVELQSSTTGQWLWVDAVCINQAADAEKSHQVNMMGRIYNRAQMVRVWLGSEADGSGAIMGLAVEVEALQKADIRHLFPGDCPALEFWKALSKLCLRGYWTRTWIIQELGIALSRSRVVMVYCGSGRMDWRTFSRLGEESVWAEPLRLGRSHDAKDDWDYYGGRVTPFDYHDLDAQIKIQIRYYMKAISTSTFQLLMDWRNGAGGEKDETNQMRGTTARPLAHLLNTYSESISSDPRDKVYALLSLASDCQGGRGLQADYSKDAATLFWEVIRFCRPKDAITFGRMLQRSLSLTSLAINQAAPHSLRPSFDSLEKRGFQVPMRLKGVIIGVRPYQLISEAGAATSTSGPCVVFTFHKVVPGHRIHDSTRGVAASGIQPLDKVFGAVDADLTLIVRQTKRDVFVVGKAVIARLGSTSETPEAMTKRFESIDQTLALELTAVPDRAKQLTVVVRELSAFVTLMTEPLTAGNKHP